MDGYLDQSDSSDQQGFRALLRFLRVVNRHRLILVGLMFAAGLFAVVRYYRQPKVYEAVAKLLVRQVNAESGTDAQSSTDLAITTYRQLVMSDEVLVNTVRDLDKTPPELTAHKQPYSWPEVLRTKLLKVSFPDDENVVHLTCRSVDPESTVRVIHALTKTSKEYMESFQQNDALETLNQLQAQRSKLESQILSKEMELLNARKACGDIVVSEGSGDSHPVVQRVSRLNEQLIAAQTRRIEIQQSLASVRAQVAAGADLSLAVQKLTPMMGPDLAKRIPGASTNQQEILDAREDELARAEVDFEAIRPHFGKGHGEYQRLAALVAVKQRRVDDARMAFQRQISVGLRDPELGKWLVDKLTTELTDATQKEQALKQEYDRNESAALALTDKLASIEATERVLGTLHKTHNSLLDTVNSLNVGSGGGVFKVVTITQPLVPQDPVAPVLATNLAVALGAALALGLGFIYVIDLMDDRLRSPEEVKEELGLNVLGVIRPLPEHQTENSRIYVHSHPQTPQAECYRTLRTGLTLSAVDTKCLAITSSEQSEGKTTTVVNLASTFAQSGQRTLLIDADMRRPGLSQLLDLRGKGGLSEILRAEKDVAELAAERVVKTEVEGLEVIPCGPRILNAGVLLSMPSLSELLDWSISEYDQVIVDCPPVLPVSDAAIVGRFVDSLLFLMNPDKTHRRSVARAVDQLRSLELKIAGVVANTTDESSDPAADGYGYGYGYGYSEGYGHSEAESENLSFGDENQADHQGEDDEHTGQAA